MWGCGSKKTNEKGGETTSATQKSVLPADRGGGEGSREEGRRAISTEKGREEGEFDQHVTRA